jgi:hypothetical protein
MPQCQFPVFCCFCVSEKLHRKYSRNWTKQKPKFLFFPTRDGGGPGAGHTLGWRGPAPGHATRWWSHLAHLLTPPFRLYIPLDGKTLSPDQFSTKHTASRHHYRREIGRVQKLFPTPCRRGESPPEAFFITIPAPGPFFLHSYYRLLFTSIIYFLANKYLLPQDTFNPFL